jgi:apolipoprotein N-acyltransferase
VAAGTLLTVANPPADLGPLAFLALIPLLWALPGLGPRRGALVGFVFGLTYYGILLNWLLLFGVIAWLPLVVSQAAYAAAFGALASLWSRAHPLRSALAAAALWTALDWVRATWPIGGFAWGGLGYTQHGNGLLLPLASLTGVWGVTFVVVLVNGLVLGGFRIATAAARAGGPGWGRAGLKIAALASATGAVLFLPALIPLPTASGPRLDVAVVQGNVPRSLSSDRLLRNDVVAQNHIWLHRSLSTAPPDLAVWPENSLAEDPTVDRQLGRVVQDVIRSVGSPTLVGAIRESPGGRYFNQTLLYSAEGRPLGRYVKIHLVPFGEYIPFPRVFGWTDRYRRGNADLIPGREIRLFPVHGVAVATPICFENVFPDLFRGFVRAGAGLVVVTTNDSSFLESPASREHVIMSQLRAVENGRWIVQAAISGESAIVDPRGRVVRHTALFRSAILRYRVPTSTSHTLYTRLGDWFPWACGLAVGVALLGRLRRSRRAKSPPAGERPPSAEPGSPPSEQQEGAVPAPISGGASDGRALVILPTYNERETIARVVAGVLAADPDADVLVVDDNSPDGTGDVAADLAEQQSRVRVLRRSGKLGLASAYLLGFRKGLDEGYEALVEMDADMSHRPQDLPRLLEASDRYDLTIGSRYVPGGGVANWSRARLALSRAGNAYARIALNLPLTDSTSGYRVYRRKLLEALLDEGVHSDGYAFQIELAYRARRSGFSVGEVPITFYEREHGKSKLSRRIVLEALVKVARWGLRDRIATRKRLPHR